MNVCPVCREQPVEQPYSDQRKKYCSEACNQKIQNWRRVKITPTEFWERLEAQTETCAMPSCDTRLAYRTAHVDHDHETGAVRGLLCAGCNVAEGHWRKAEALGVREYLGIA